MPASGRPKFFFAAVLLALGGCAPPREETPVEGAEILKVVIRYRGPKSVGEERLRTHIRTTEGSRYESKRTDDDIKALYESGLVNDVRVLAEPKRGGVEMIFEVQTRGRERRGSHFHRGGMKPTTSFTLQHAE